MVKLLIRTIVFGCYWLVFTAGFCGADSPMQDRPIAITKKDDLSNVRRPSSDDELRKWLENMVVYHRFTDDEVRSATGMSLDEIRAARTRLQISADKPVATQNTGPLRVLPYPGGRHPRIGFLEGAIDPLRETKASVFAPWDASSYVVLDVPEAIFSNLGLLYLAHTHVPTIWDKQGVKLPVLEWRERAGGVLELERTLPNDVVFGTRLTPRAEGVTADMWLTNGTAERLTDLRVQVCALLRGMPGFDQQTNDNKFFWQEYSTCHNPDKTRWVIAAFVPVGRAWGNAECPCLHADPKFPDCDPGETVRCRGWLSFYEGRDIEAELQRIEATGWRGAQ